LQGRSVCFRNGRGKVRVAEFREEVAALHLLAGDERE
jgi:hypothetical protein